MIINKSTQFRESGFFASQPKVMPTGNEGCEFEYQYWSAALFISL